MVTAKQYDLDLSIVDATDRINTRQRERFLARILDTLPPGATVGVWGLAFKPKTDDMRDAPSLDIIPALIQAVHTVQAYDPSAMQNARTMLPTQTRFVDAPQDAAIGADALVLLTEWDVFRGADFGALRESMKGTHVFDGRNVYEPSDVRAAGLTYHGIGIGDATIKTR
jgi:UDPglucose 6-dehydrogenase